MREIVNRGIVSYADVLDELRYLADTGHPIAREVNEEERRVYYVLARDAEGAPVDMGDVSYAHISNLVRRITK